MVLNRNGDEKERFGRRGAEIKGSIPLGRQ
jgi:hypothetical protein